MRVPVFFLYSKEEFHLITSTYFVTCSLIRLVNNISLGISINKCIY
uniref:Uncharacterized protein n=1 Tax=Lepeophtheirus salmonis TaxID=72036 RepID=A0A0K2TLD4_LEPSM